MFLTLITRRYSGGQPTYWARHFACALDVFEILTAALQHGQIAVEDGTRSSGNDKVFFRFVQKDLCKLTSQTGEWRGYAPICMPVATITLSTVHRFNLSCSIQCALFPIHSAAGGHCPRTSRCAAALGLGGAE